MAVGSKPPVVVRASDDYGLGRSGSSPGEPRGGRRRRERSEVKTLATWSKFAARAPCSATPSSSTRRGSSPGRRFGCGPWPATAARSTFLISSSGRRSRPRPGSRSTSWRPRPRPRPSWPSSTSLRTALAKILQDQLRARACGGRIEQAHLRRRPRPARRPLTSAGQQAGVQKATTAVIASIGSTDDRRSAHHQARGEQAGLRRDGPGRPPGRGVGARQVRHRAAQAHGRADGDAGQDRRRPPPLAERDQARIGRPAGRDEEAARGPSSPPTSRASSRT